MKSLLCALALAGAVVPFVCGAETVVVQSATPYAKDAIIAGKIKRECKITTQLPEFVADYAHKDGMTVDLKPSIDTKAPGEVLSLTIINAVSRGNAWLGHHKSTTVRGKLYRDGKEVGSFVGRRNSMGGAFAGFKGSCSVLGRTVKALGRDIATWMQHPVEGSQLGDLR